MQRGRCKDCRVVRITKARPEDWPQVWTFFREIVVAGETFAYDREMTESEARDVVL
jgi:hypothetical protein